MRNISNICNTIFNYKNSEITLKIKGPGYQQIYFPDNVNCLEIYNVKSYYFFPDEIYINSIRQNNINYQYYFDETENLVKLIWYNNLNSANCLYREYKNIIEIDFSKLNPIQKLLNWIQCSIIVHF